MARAAFGLVAGVHLLSACAGSPKEGSESHFQRCNTDADCTRSGERCSGERCVGPSASADAGPEAKLTPVGPPSTVVDSGGPPIAECHSIMPNEYQTSLG